MSSSSCNSGRVDFFCRCGDYAKLTTSWTQANPGRRFYACKYGQDKGCNYFRWHDDEMSDQAKRVIWGLLKKLKVVEERKRASQWRKKLVLIVVLILFIIWTWIMFRFNSRFLCSMRTVKELAFDNY